MDLRLSEKGSIHGSLGLPVDEKERHSIHRP